MFRIVGFVWYVVDMKVTTLDFYMRTCSLKPRNLPRGGCVKESIMKDSETCYCETDKCNNKELHEYSSSPGSPVIHALPLLVAIAAFVFVRID